MPSWRRNRRSRAVGRTARHAGASARQSVRRATVARNRAARRSLPRAPANAEDAADGDEINLIGCTVEEATRRADKFIDNAALAGKPQVRVIHGHGTGALRRGLAQFFSAHPLVERIHAEADERGGAAVTVVELKE